MFHWKKVVPGTFTPSAPTTPDAPARESTRPSMVQDGTPSTSCTCGHAVLVALRGPRGPEVVRLGEMGVGVDDAEAVEPGARHRVIVTRLSACRASGR